MKLLYFDLIGGAAGDMILGALVDAGLSFEALQEGLAQLKLPEFKLSRERVMRGAFAATKIDVCTPDSARQAEAHRHLGDVLRIIEDSDLEPPIKIRAARIFGRMAEAEARIHGKSVDEVHFHELGAVDTIVDVTGALLGLRLLGVDRVVASPVPLGRGLAEGAHGTFPLPAPATVALLKGAPVVGVDHPVETVTPTAAALLTDVVDSYGAVPPMQLAAVGYGAGTRVTPEPNILRVLVGEDATVAESGHGSSGAPETLTLLETNIDNTTGEVLGYVAERLLASGALDAYLAPIQMKKGRPAVVLSVLCRPADAPALRALIFSETSTLGIREQSVNRHCLPRAFHTVRTEFGEIRMKAAGWGDVALKAAPEFEDCRRAAETNGVPLMRVYEAAMRAWGEQRAPSQ